MSTLGDLFDAVPPVSDDDNRASVPSDRETGFTDISVVFDRLVRDYYDGTPEESPEETPSEPEVSAASVEPVAPAEPVHQAPPWPVEEPEVTGTTEVAPELITGVRDDNFLRRLAFEDQQPEASRLQGVLDGNPVHSTMLPDLCPRMVALMRRYNVQPMERTPSSNDRLIWATGRIFEAHIRKQLIKNIGPEHVYGGSLSCECKRHQQELLTRESPHQPEVTCEHCGTGSYSLYHEAVLRHEPSHSTSGPDLGHWNQDGKLVINEIKSKKLEGFLALTKPESLHVRQAVFYNRVAQAIGESVADYVQIIYGAKGYVNYEDGLPYKVYRVDLSEARLHLRGADTHFATGEEVKRVIEDPSYTPERTCAEPGITMAKNCQVCAMCFSLKR